MGRWAEDQAARFLEAKGYRILARNFRTRRSEVDLIVTDGNALVFVEVKARRNRQYGSPWEAVDVRKRRRLAAAAAEFWALHPRHQGKTLRFDVVAVERTGDGWRLRWLPDAFSPLDGNPGR